MQQLKKDDDGRIVVTEGDVDHFTQGLPVSRDGELVITHAGNMHAAVRGLPFDPQGRLLVGSGDTRRVQGGIPFALGDRVAIDDDGQVESVQNGIPFTGDSKVAVINSGVFDFRFYEGAPLDPRLTFSRSTPAWYWKNGVLVEAGINEPVFEDGALRLEAAATEAIPNNTNVSSTNEDWSINPVNDDSVPNAFLVKREGSITSASAWVRTSIPQYPLGSSFFNTYSNSGKVSWLVKKQEGFIRCGSSSSGSSVVVNTLSGAVVYIGSHVVNVNVLDRGSWFEVNMIWLPPNASSSSFLFQLSDSYTSRASLGEPSVGYEAIVALPSFRDSSTLIESPIPTYGTPATRAADNLSLTGEAFQKVFNPNEGALVFKVGEGSAAPKVILGPLEFDNMQSGETLALAWHGDEFKVFRDGAADGTFTQDMTGAAELKFEAMYLKSFSLFSTRPTDAELEALTSA